mmetsp:Transcript_13115/g.24540  ORF Transcript_13115/g.24540 Transcript_13115/m.24540 type:complete len:205 (-) Transcript_13115:1183-1797(-)
MSRPGLSINSPEGYELTEFSRTPSEPTPAVPRPAPHKPPQVQSQQFPHESQMQQMRSYPTPPPPPQYPHLSQPGPTTQERIEQPPQEARHVEELFVQCSVCRVTLRYARGVPLVMCPCCRSYTATEQMFFLRCFRCGSAYYSQPGARPFYCNCGLIVYPPTQQSQSTAQPPAQAQVQTPTASPTPTRLSTERLPSVDVTPSSLG